MKWVSRVFDGSWCQLNPHKRIRENLGGFKYEVGSKPTPNTNPPTSQNFTILKTTAPNSNQFLKMSTVLSQRIIMNALGSKREMMEATHRFFISAAIVMNACSTLVEFLALVSKKGIPISSANAFGTERTSSVQNQQ